MAPSTSVLRGAITIPVDATDPELVVGKMDAGKVGKKRKRVSRACDQCFAKKDRCDGTTPICTFCKTLKRECTYLRPERKRGPTQGLRPRLEQRIVALETVLGFMLSDADRSRGGGEAHLVSQLLAADATKRDEWQSAWLGSSMRKQLASDPYDFKEDLVADSGNRWRQRSAASGSQPLRRETKRGDSDAEQGDTDESEYSDVDLLLQAQSLLPLPRSHSDYDDERTPPDAVRPTEDLTMPLLSSGKGGSSLNRGLVPKGADPNAALGGFEIQFGGNEHDEDWVRGFVVPSANSKRSNKRL